jgi:hypothetical protein
VNSKGSGRGYGRWVSTVCLQEVLFIFLSDTPQEAECELRNYEVHCGHTPCPQTAILGYSYMATVAMVIRQSLRAAFDREHNLDCQSVYYAYTDIQYIQRIYTYNLQSQLIIFSLFSLILSLHVSVPTDHLQVDHVNIFVFMRRIIILHRHIHFTFIPFSQLFI